MNERGAKQHFSIQAFQVFDATLIWLSFAMASWVHDPLRSLLGMPELEAGGLAGMTWVVFIVVPLTPLVLERFGHYDRLLSRRGFHSLSILLRGMLTVMLIIGIVAVFGKIWDTRRLVLGSGILLSFLLLWLRTHFTSQILRARAASEGLLERVVLAGEHEETGGFLKELDNDILEAWKVVCHFDLNSKSVEELDNLIKRESVQRVVFLTAHTEFERVARAVEACEVQGVEAWIGASFLRTSVARPSFDAIGGQPMLVFRSTPELSWQLFAKKLVDIVGALTAVILFSPFWIAAMIGIRLASPGAPVFFTQQRAGLYGKPFRIFKFRTMVPDADKMLDQIKEEHGNEVDGPAFKLASDPRIFSFGQFLRNYSIDELPQMINVLKGEMSLVGPRPLPVHEIAAIEKSSHRRRLSMKPGITCIWQISGRSDITDFEEWVKLDLEYIDRWSLWEDFRILFKTIPAVLFSKGAR
ncbi:MAG: exopolysaccharide biosynthesis polyprenyl glycosylphosphotransferase [Akkermansiaceae bacterium]|jgi:exopolysaccharide biosynthesis polyprenyl glycosylphosphotransferase